MEKLDKKKLGFIVGAAVAGLALIVLILCFVLNGNNRSYDNYFAQAQSDFLSGNYSRAIENLEKAIEIKADEECYLLMAESYKAGGDLDMAIQILQIGASRLESSDISARLEELKAEKNGLVIDPGKEPDGSISIGGKNIDPASRSLLLNEMQLTSADIAPLSSLTNLESLSLSNNSISDISALKTLTSLNFLQLDGNSVSDLSPLASLSGLKTLYIDNNPISDFAPLHSLSSLRTLSMKGVSITESQLRDLEKALPNCKIYADTVEDEVVEITLGGKTFTSDVTELDLGGLGISDISALSQCTELVKLDLRDNSISDISALVDLQKLEYLNIWNNKVIDISPLMSLVKLNYLDADNNKISNISVLEYLPDLQQLWLSGNPLSNIKPIKTLSSLSRLGLKNTGLEDSDLELLAEIKSLTELTIEKNDSLTANAVDELKEALPNCKISHSELLYVIKLGSSEFKSDATSISASGMNISDISGLEHFTALKTLILNSNSISDISPLSSCKELGALELYGNRISDLSPLSSLTKLHSLSLLSNSISDISPLSGLTELTELYLSFNTISDISALSSMTKLRILNLDGNTVKDISALSSLAGLKELSLEDNLIEDLTPLYDLTGLEQLYIRGNSALSIEDVYALQQALPNCRIISNHDLNNYDPEPSPTPSSTAG